MRRSDKIRCVVDEGDRNTVSCSTNTSRWSSPCCGSDGPEDPSDAEQGLDRTPDERPSGKLQGSQESGHNGGVQKQEMKHETLRLPPVRPLQGYRPRKESENANCIWALKSRVWELQQQLSEARTENKLLKKSQHQQRFRDPEAVLDQILAKHCSETKALQGLLRETRTTRDDLARKLQDTDRKLLGAKDALQQLRRLSQDQSLLEREQLTQRLARVSSQLEDRDRRIQNLEKTVELHQESFKRQMASERRKLKEAGNRSVCLEELIQQFTRELQLSEKEVQKQYIHYHRVVKGTNKRGRVNRMVQTEEVVLTAPGLWKGDGLNQNESLVDRKGSVN